MNNAKQTDLETATDAIGEALTDFYYAEGFDAIADAHDIVMDTIYKNGEEALAGISYEVCEKIAQTKIDA